MTSSLSFHPARIFHGERNRDGGAHFAQHAADQRQIAQQARPAIALHHLIHRTSEIQIEYVEAQILADARRLGQHRRIGAEELRGDRMLVGVEGEIA